MAATGGLETYRFNGQGLSHVSRHKLLVATLVVFVLAVVIAVLSFYKRPGPVRCTEALVKAFKKRRLIEPRLSGGFHAAPFRPRNGDDLSDVDTEKLNVAREAITPESERRDDPQVMLALGRFLLLAKGDSRGALKVLRAATERAPEIASVHNDIGVCLFEQGKLEDSLEEFERALAVDAKMPEALFNRALCYQRLLLMEESASGFSSLKQIERDPSWLEELTDREKDVSRPPAQMDPDEVMKALRAGAAEQDTERVKAIADQNFESIRKYALINLFRAHLEAAVTGDVARAERSFSGLDLIGKALSESRGDKQVADAASYLRTLPERERPTELGLITEWNAAYKQLVAGKAAVARPKFERLSRQFLQRGNHVFQVSSAFNLASCCYYLSNSLITSVEILKSILPIVEQRGWVYQTAGTLLQLAIGYARLGLDSLAIKYCEKALAQAVGMPEVKAKADQFVSNAYWHIGDLDTSLLRLRESTNLFLEYQPRPEELASNYLNIADIYRLRDKHSLAALYAEQALRLSERVERNRLAAQASSFLAVEAAKSADFQKADENLRRAFGHLSKIESGQRRYPELLVLARAGTVSVTRGETESAVQYYSRAEALAASAAGDIVPRINALRGRAEAFVASKKIDLARSDLQKAISLTEGYRTNISESEFRSKFLDQSQEVFDMTISLAIDSLNRTSEAFDMSERSRARALLEEISNKSVQPLKLEQVQAGLPENLTLVEYSVTNRGTYIFVVSRTSLAASISPVTVTQLDDLVHAYISDLKSVAPIEEVNEKGRTLYRYLIEPIEPLLSRYTNLCIVPDKALHFLPFAALVDQSGSYLVLSRRLTYSPSASVLIRCLAESRTKPRRNPESILAVGDPGFDRDLFPNLPVLPEAEHEAKESAAVYDSSTVLTGRQATEPRVRAAMGECDVAHLAVHCLVDEQSPWLAALVLTAPGREADGRAVSTEVGARSPSGSGTPLAYARRDEGLLYLQDVYRIKLRRTRLVVLSACQSALGHYYRGEGIVSLVRPFLAVRVPTVVASLWSVDSQATARLMVDFHSVRRKSGAPAGDALRAAQLKMMGEVLFQHPYYWAPFISVGANM